jgi:hypothetical protein
MRFWKEIHTSQPRHNDVVNVRLSLHLPTCFKSGTTERILIKPVVEVYAETSSGLFIHIHVSHI